MDKKSLLFVVGLIVVTGLSVNLLPESPSKEVIVTAIGLVYAVAYFISFRKKTSEKEKVIKAKN